jgi:nucleoside-diphosphate-sugar epimerase
LELIYEEVSAMKVLVMFWSAGFTGQNTVKLLIESGHECICLVCVNSIKDALEGIGCQFIIGDIQLKRRELNMKGDKVAWDIYKYNLMSEAGLRRTK